MNKTEQKAAEKIAGIRDTIQEFMNENITSYETRMSAPAIFEAMGDAVGEVTKQEFQLGLSVSIRNGLITGFRGIRGRNGGYSPVGDNDNDEDNDGDSGVRTPEVRIELGDGVAISKSDPLNWSLEGLGAKRYWPTLSSAIKNATKILLDNEIKKVANGNVKELESIPSLIEKAERNIIEAIEKASAKE